jgi:alpha-methylacyl-CoA racemase
MGEPSGPLKGLRVIEFAGIGPAPMCGMLMSDLGADVVRIDRPGAAYDRFAIEARGRRSVRLDLKSDVGLRNALDLVGAADALIEGFRPGVMERLGLGPEIVLQRNRGLVYGRMTGWGQTGPYAQSAGHDINYIAVTGALHAMGPPERPAIPLNLVGDFGGGALVLAFGVVSAVLHARETGEGQVVDCAMAEGTIALMGMLYGHLQRGGWLDRRESNIIDGGSPFYNVYRCSDGGWISLGSIEPQFYARLLQALGVADPDFEAQHDQSRWPRLREKLAGVIATRTRAEWTAVLEGADLCFAPVLSMTEAPAHPQNKARGAFVEVDGVLQPAPVPRFSQTPGAIQGGPDRPSVDIADVLSEWEASPGRRRREQGGG